MKNNQISGKHEFESPLPHLNNPLKPALVAGFELHTQNSVKSLSSKMPSFFNFRAPVLVKAKSGWYVEYYYLVPEEIRSLYKKKEWKRFRVTADMNRRKGEDREQFAGWLLAETARLLKGGYNPFKPTEDLAEMQAAGISLPKVMTCQQAFDAFIKEWNTRGLEPGSMEKYKKCVNRLSEWTGKRNLYHEDVRRISTDHIEAFLRDGREDYGFSNRERNNTLGFLGTCFRYLKKKKIIPDNPCDDIGKLKAPSTKHKYYDSVALDKIVRAMKEMDPYLHFACQVIYHLCIRSEKELKNLQVGGIKMNENVVLINAGGSKTNSDRYIPMSESIKRIFIERGVMDYPADYFVFGIKGAPTPNKFGKEFLSQRFGKCRNVAGLGQEHTMMGFRHTRAVHLKLDGAKDNDIMTLFGHTDFATTSKYLRALGVQADPKAISDRTREI